MSRGLNEIKIIGNLGKAPDMKYTPAGKAVSTFSVAVNEKWGDSEEQERTEWFNCEAWGKSAEILNQYLKSGSKVYVCGRNKTDKWEKDGVPHSRSKVVVKEFLFLGDSNGSGETLAEAQTQPEESFEFGAD